MKTKIFRDFDAFAASIRGVESRMLLRNPKGRLWTIDSIELDGVDVQFGRLGSGNIAQGQLRSDGFMIYLPLSDNVEYRANGVQLKKGSFAILEPGCEFCISTKVEHDWCAVFVPIHLIGLDSETRSTRTCRVAFPTIELSNCFRTITNQVLHNASLGLGFESTLAGRLASTELTNVCLSIIGSSNPLETKPDGRPKLSRDQIIRCSMELIENDPDTSVTVKDLAMASDVSERTLRSSFNEVFEIGPTRYLRLRRLHQVRHALLAADSNQVSVSEILMANGEWAFSRFAARYKQLFGELPSQTLRVN